MVKIAMIALSGVLLALLVRQQKAEYALLITLATAVFILICSVGRLESVMETVKTMESYIQMDSSMVRILVKMIGITYVAEFAAGICRDSGYGALGSQMEMFARLSILAVSVPVLLALIETVEEVLAV